VNSQFHICLRELQSGNDNAASLNLYAWKLDLNAIIIQLEESQETDKKGTDCFLKTISQSTANQVQTWEGEHDRFMQSGKDYYYNPYTKGSNSIKAVLPGSLNSSKF
jgi:Cft2 family RNA processing exonuclease